jgi:hypothetical protein
VLTVVVYRAPSKETDEDTLRKVEKDVLKKSFLTTGKSFVSESQGRLFD